MDFKELITSRNIIIFFVILIIILGIYWFSTRRGSFRFFENFENATTPPTTASNTAPFQTTQTMNLDKPDSASGVPNRALTDPSQLLPNSKGADWGNLYPVQNDGGVYVPSLTDPSFQIGINTISSTLKNASLDIRSQPIIPKVQLSPWNNSSFVPDLGKISLDPSIGDN